MLWLFFPFFTKTPIETENACVVVCGRERKRECACVWERESVCVWVREKESVCVSDRERVLVCVRERESACLWERECMRVFVCVCERECVCVLEREKERLPSLGIFWCRSFAELVVQLLPGCLLSKVFARCANQSQVMRVKSFCCRCIQGFCRVEWLWSWASAGPWVTPLLRTWLRTVQS